MCGRIYDWTQEEKWKWLGDCGMEHMRKVGRDIELVRLNLWRRINLVRKHGHSEIEHLGKNRNNDKRWKQNLMNKNEKNVYFFSNDGHLKKKKNTLENENNNNKNNDTFNSYPNFHSILEKILLGRNLKRWKRKRE